MYTDEDLDSAVKAGILSAGAAAEFRAHAAGKRSSFGADEEHFRLISGFNDVFVVIASLLLLAAVAWILGAAAPAAGGVGVAAAAWLLAEFFVRQRRMALPAIVLFGAFVGGVFFAAIAAFGRMDVHMAFAGGTAAIAAWVHWVRFHVPITVAAGVSAAVLTVVSALMSVVPALQNYRLVLLLVAGVAVFLLAMHWDASDAERQTRRSDVAFWLHLVAAPMIVHPVFLTVGMQGGPQALVIFALYVVIAFVSLAIDRRALMVSALGYVLYTFASLLRGVGDVGFTFSVTALVIGSCLLLLSAFWQQCRAFSLQWVPQGLRQRLPPSQR